MVHSSYLVGLSAEGCETLEFSFLDVRNPSASFANVRLSNQKLDSDLSEYSYER